MLGTLPLSWCHGDRCRSDFTSIKVVQELESRKGLANFVASNCLNNNKKFENMNCARM